MASQKPKDFVLCSKSFDDLLHLVDSRAQLFRRVIFAPCYIFLFFLAFFALPASSITVDEQFKTPAELQKRIAGIKTGPNAAFLVFADAQNGVELTENRAVINVPKYFQMFYFPNANAKTYPNPDALFNAYNKAAYTFSVLEGNTQPPVQLVLESPTGTPVLDGLDCNSAFKNTCVIRPAPGLKIKLLKGGKGAESSKEGGTITYANIQLQVLLRKDASAAVFLFTDWSKGIHPTVSSRTAYFDAPRGMDAFVFASITEEERKNPALLILRTKDASARLSIFKKVGRERPFAPVKLAVTHPRKNITGKIICKLGSANYCLVVYERRMRFEFRDR